LTTIGSSAQLYGDFDQNLALIEQRLKVSATPRGNHVLLKGAASFVDQARRVLESLYGSARGRALGRHLRRRRRSSA
jgi:phosphate starvation-inducible protein PhoH